MPRTYNEVDARVTRLMKELENLKKELACKQGLLEAGDGIELTPDAQTNKTTVSVDDNVVALKADFGANPVLSGSEPTLEGLKLLGTDYKVGGGGDLYQHLIEIKSVSTGGFPYADIGFSIAIVSKNNLSFTPSEILTILGQSIFKSILKNRLIGAVSPNTILYLTVNTTAIHTDGRLYSTVSINNWDGTLSSPQCFYSVTDTVTLI